MKRPLAKFLYCFPALNLWVLGIAPLYCVIFGAFLFLRCLKMDKSKSERTPCYAIFARLAIWMLVVVGVMLHLLNKAANYQMVSFWEITATAYVSLYVLLGMLWISTFFGEQFEQDNPDYHFAKANGFVALYDLLPVWLNPDSHVTRRTGIQEPVYTNFVPPPYWKYQCPVCGARVQNGIDVCWKCNYGADGDPSAYYQRFGMNLPPLLPPDPEPEPPDEPNCPTPPTGPRNIAPVQPRTY